MFLTMDISTSALVAQRTNLNTIAGNIAGMHTTRTEEGGPYRRRIPLFAAGDGAGNPGVHVAEIVKSDAPFRKEWNPSHPDAVKSGADAGYVLMPNVDYSTEMINALEAARIYEANVTVMDITKTLAAASLRLLA